MTRISRRDAEKLLGNVAEEYVFRCCDGRILRNTRELAEALTTMSDEAFAFHANEAKNDFSNWVTDIIADKDLARDLRKAVSRTQAAKRVSDRVTFLTRKLV